MLNRRLVQENLFGNENCCDGKYFQELLKNFDASTSGTTNTQLNGQEETLLSVDMDLFIK